MYVCVCYVVHVTPSYIFLLETSFAILLLNYIIFVYSLYLQNFNTMKY